LARTTDLLDEQRQKVDALRTALRRAPTDHPALTARLHEVRAQLLELNEALRGSEAKEQIGELGPPTPSSRLSVGMRGLGTTYGPTELHRRAIVAGRSELEPLRAEVRRMAEQVVPELASTVRATGAPPVEGVPSGG
ncbi:MAG: hypothetical protein KY466_07505, partial [Gemmatimonadetes bacterium]|nr:hypothetical protein [Gemmatimonadota bacterium]